MDVEEPNLEAGRLVFSSCEALLLIERARKNAEIPAYKFGGGWEIRIERSEIPISLFVHAR